MIRYSDSEGSKRKLQARIVVIGAGGAGGNAVNRMIEKQVPGVEFVAANTDTMALQMTSATVRVQLGVESCEGLGAGGEPSVGREAAVENIGDLEPYLAGADMIFITAGMGGGTGTGAAPVIARAAKDLGALTVAVVTKPFHFEGKRRMRQALKGLEALREYADTLLVIPNEKLVDESEATTTIEEAFGMADEVLYQAVRGISDLITQPGYINLDFADVREIMGGMGMSLMGTADAEGENRVSQAISGAVECPLLESHSIDGATGILMNITGGGDLPLKEVNQVIGELFKRVDPEANIIWGYVFDESYRDRVKATVIATGFDRSTRAVSQDADSTLQDVIPVAPEPTAPDQPEPESPEEPTSEPVVQQSEEEPPPEPTAPPEDEPTSGLRIQFALPQEEPAPEPEPAMEPEPEPEPMSEPTQAPVSMASTGERVLLTRYRPRNLGGGEATGESMFQEAFFSPHGAEGRLFLRRSPKRAEG